MIFIRPCPCGNSPKFAKWPYANGHCLQLRCPCRKPCGAVLWYSKPEDEARMLQAAIDGWNIGH